MRNLRLYNVVVCAAAIVVACTLTAALADVFPIPAFQFGTQPIPATAIAYPVPGEDANASAISCMKRLPDGASVCVHQKTVVATSITSIYIEETDRAAGITVRFGNYYPPAELARGSLVSFSGVMGTSAGERIINARSPLICDPAATVRISSLGITEPAIVGWKPPKNSQFPRQPGLVPLGLSVRLSGRVTARDMLDTDGSWFFYLDDGTNYQDATSMGFTGIRIYSDMAPPGDFVTVIGVLTTKLYDPTPVGPTGDEFVLPFVRTTDADDVILPDSPPVNTASGPVCGRVRLVGQAAPGGTVRIYSEHGSVLVNNVTDDWTNFTLDSIPENGAKVAASAPGYISGARDAVAGQQNVDFELERSDYLMELGCTPAAVRVCSDQVSLVSAMLRDCEGKGIPGQQVRIVTTRGTFTESGTRDVILTTDKVGFAYAHLKATPDGAGLASLRADRWPSDGCAAFASVDLVGASITASASVLNLAQPGTSTITTHLTDLGASVRNALITFKTDCGVFSESGVGAYSTLTDDTGSAQATLTLSDPGTALVLVSYSNECSQQVTNWVVVSYNSSPFYAQGSQTSSPLVADLEGRPDGKKDIAVVTSDNKLIVLDSQSTLLWSQEMPQTASNTPSCSVVDADRSGLPCIFIGSENQPQAYAFAHNGAPLAGWPTASDFRFLRCSLAIGDVNLDGTPEVIGGDECCYIFSWNPTGNWAGAGSNNSFLWRNLTGTPSTAVSGSSCAVGDIDGDPNRIPDVVVGTNHAPELYAFPGDVWGDFISNPLYIDGWPKTTDSRCESSPAIGDFDGDGKNDIAVGGDDVAVYLHRSSDNTWLSIDCGGMVKSSPALADLDGDGKLDIVVGSSSGRVFALDDHGQALPGWGGGIRLNNGADFIIDSSPVVGDVNGDGKVEVVIGSSDGNVYALYCDGMNHQENGLLTGPIAWVRSCTPPGGYSTVVDSAPAICDLDNDGKVDVVAASHAGIYVFHINAPYVYSPALYPWPTFHHDNQRTGCSTPPSSPINASIQGIISDAAGNPVTGARVSIYLHDGSPVQVPHSTAPRGNVLSVGSTDPSVAGRGAYCISQLDPNTVYKISVTYPSGQVKTIDDINVTTGLTRVDVRL